ncbi:hypothetical protein [Petrachloros mirabilis]
MTQELVLVALLTALVGLVWMMTVSILADDIPKSAKEHAQRSEEGSSDNVDAPIRRSSRQKSVA